MDLFSWRTLIFLNEILFLCLFSRPDMGRCWGYRYRFYNLMNREFVFVDERMDDGFEFFGIAFSFWILMRGLSSYFIGVGHKIFNGRIHGEEL